MIIAPLGPVEELPTICGLWGTPDEGVDYLTLDFCKAPDCHVLSIPNHHP